MPFITTYSGHQIDIFSPKPEDFTIQEIARGLSNTVRFGGQIHNFYSVAEHSIKVSHWLDLRYRDKQLNLEGLLHDATEAYLNDLMSPFKYILIQYMEIENLWTEAIAKRFELRYPFDKRIKEADSAVYEWELEHIKNSHLYIGYEPQAIYKKFLTAYDQLTKTETSRGISKRDIKV